jgi:hypothetical protein
MKPLRSWDFSNFSGIAQSALDISHKILATEDDLPDKFFPGTKLLLEKTIGDKFSADLTVLIGIFSKLAQNPGYRQEIRIIYGISSCRVTTPLPLPWFTYHPGSHRIIGEVIVVNSRLLKLS